MTPQSGWPQANIAAQRKYRILRVITQSEAEAGGSHHHVFHLTSDLDPERYETTVVCGTGGELLGRLREAGLEVIAMPHLVRRVSPLRDLSAFFQLYRLIRREQYDIVATHSSKAGLLGRLAPSALGPPSPSSRPTGSPSTNRVPGGSGGSGPLWSAWAPRPRTASSRCRTTTARARSLGNSSQPQR